MDDNNMMNVRKHGGFNFASAMLRYNITTDGYIKHVTSIINRFLFNDQHMVNVFVSGDNFCIVYNNKIIISDNFNYIERLRVISFKEFDSILISSLEDEGCTFDKNHFYYESVMLS